MPSGRCSSRRTASRRATGPRRSTLSRSTKRSAADGSRRLNWLAAPPRLRLLAWMHLDLGTDRGRGPGNEDIDERTYLRRHQLFLLVDDGHPGFTVNQFGQNANERAAFEG